MIRIDTFTKTVEDWLLGVDWIDHSHPAVHSIKTAAVELDNKLTIAMYKEFNSMIKYIDARKPEVKEISKPDPLLGLQKR